MVKKFVIASVVFLVVVFLGVFGFWFIGEKNRIAFVSDVSGYRVTKADMTDFKNFLQEVDFWEKNRVKLRKREIYGQAMTVRKLVIHLTQEKYVHGAYVDENKKVIYSNKEEYEKGVLHLYVGIDSKYWTDTKRLAELVRVEMLSGIYELTEPENYFGSTKMTEILTEKTDKIYVTIEKIK